MSANKNISLFIPFVFPNFDRDYVAEAFAQIGEVERIDLVAKQDRDGKSYNAVYIHFKKWHNNRFAAGIITDILNNGSTKFYHDKSEYFWIVLPNTAKKHIPGERKPRLDLGEANSVSLKSIEKTPEKSLKEEVTCPSPPKKSTYADTANIERESHNGLNLLDEFDAEASEETIEMAEIEAELEAEDENLISIDYRYVQSIEEENFWLHGEIAQLRMALINLDQMYQAEKAKVRAFNNIETSVDL